MDSPIISSATLLLRSEASGDENQSVNSKKSTDNPEINKWMKLKASTTVPDDTDLKLKLKTDAVNQLRELQNDIIDTEWMFNKNF